MGLDGALCLNYMQPPPTHYYLEYSAQAAHMELTLSQLVHVAIHSYTEL